MRADVVVIGVYGAPESSTGRRDKGRTKGGKDRTITPAPGSADVVDAFGKGFLESLGDIGASTKVGATCKLPSAGKVKAPMVLTVGLGPEPTGEADLDVLRRAAGAAARATAGKDTVALALPASTDEQIRAVVEGALLGSYAFDRYLACQGGARG